VRVKRRGHGVIGLCEQSHCRRRGGLVSIVVGDTSTTSYYIEEAVNRQTSVLLGIDSMEIARSVPRSPGTTAWESASVAQPSLPYEVSCRCSPDRLAPSPR